MGVLCEIKAILSPDGAWLWADLGNLYTKIHWANKFFFSKISSRCEYVIFELHLVRKFVYVLSEHNLVRKHVFVISEHNLVRKHVFVIYEHHKRSFVKKNVHKKQGPLKNWLGQYQASNS